MSIYNWIQKTIFNIYEEWHMKNPNYNRNGFHIDGINNSLKNMRDGYIMYTEIYPPYAVRGCTSMKAVVGKGKDLVNLYMEIFGKRYCAAALSYDETVQIMRSFVKDSVLPEKEKYIEVLENDSEKIKNSFAQLSELLIEDSKHTETFLKRVKLENMEDVETAWGKLCEDLLFRGKAANLDWKSGKDIFLHAVKKLSADLDLEINETVMDENEDIPRWSKILNAQWTDYILAAMDMGSDGYVLIVLEKGAFHKAKELARGLLHRIAAAEEM